MRYFAFVMLALFALPRLGAAQELSALKEHDVDQVIDIAADRVEVRERANEAEFSGAVEVTQGDMVLRADSLTVYYERGGDDLTIQRLDAQGNVALSSPSEEVTGAWGIYDVERSLVTIGGDVNLRRGGTRIHGERLVLNLDSGLTTLDGTAPGPGEDRVQGRFTVPARDADTDEREPEGTP